MKSSKLKPIIASKKYYLNTTDEYPILFIISALISGKSSFSGIKDLKNKESDRISELQKILKQINVRSKFANDKLVILGRKFKYKDQNINVPICMSAAILALATGVKTRVKNFETVKTSSPNFLKIVQSLGGKFEKKKI